MRYYLDTEFIESPGKIDLLSIGIVSEDGREFYAETNDVDHGTACKWVRQNVLPHLWSRQQDKSAFNRWSRDGGTGGLMRTRDVGPAIRRWIGEDVPEFWGYYADYDWVLFCWLFGKMVDLPDGWPMFCRDVQQLKEYCINQRLPEQDETEHHALCDGRWIRDAHDVLTTDLKNVRVECGCAACARGEKF